MGCVLFLKLAIRDKPLRDRSFIYVCVCVCVCVWYVCIYIYGLFKPEHIYELKLFSADCGS